MSVKELKVLVCWNNNNNNNNNNIKTSKNTRGKSLLFPPKNQAKFNMIGRIYGDDTCLLLGLEFWGLAYEILESSLCSSFISYYTAPSSINLRIC